MRISQFAFCRVQVLHEKEAMAFTLRVNGKTHSVDVDGHATPLGVARRIGHDRHEIRLRHGAGVRPCCAAIVPRRRAAPRRSRPSKRSARPRPVQRSRRPGSTAKLSNAVTANPDKSCPLRRCWRANRARRMLISMKRCLATSAAAAPISAFAKQSNRPLNLPDKEADREPRSNRVRARRIAQSSASGNQLFPTRDPCLCRCRPSRAAAASVLICPHQKGE